MNTDIFINNEEAGKRIMALAGESIYHADSQSCIARMKDGKLIGGAVFSDYTKSSIQVHCAGPNRHWLSRKLLWMVFHYAFVQLDVQKIIAPVRASNTRSVAFLQHLGFKLEAMIEDVYPDGAAFIYGMYRQDCRWLDLAKV